MSTDHTSGWHALHGICVEAGIDSSRTTATKQRHRVGTLFAALELARGQSYQVLRHMGHSEEVNRNVYADPLALQELCVVGTRLQEFDEGEWPCGFVICDLLDIGFQPQLPLFSYLSGPRLCHCWSDANCRRNEVAS